MCPESRLCGSRFWPFADEQPAMCAAPTAPTDRGAVVSRTDHGSAVTHAWVLSDVQCKITWYPAFPVDQLVALELEKPVVVPVPSVPLDAVVVE